MTLHELAPLPGGREGNRRPTGDVVIGDVVHEQVRLVDAAWDTVATHGAANGAPGVKAMCANRRPMTS